MLKEQSQKLDVTWLMLAMILLLPAIAAYGFSLGNNVYLANLQLIEQLNGVYQIFQVKAQWLSLTLFGG